MKSRLLTLFLPFLYIIPSLLSAQETPNPKPKILIIGAGVSGLAAAKTLYDEGEKDFIVLEAASQIGGRTQTVFLEDGTSLDLGASWIHGMSKKNPLYSLAKKVPLKSVKTEFDNISYYNTTFQKISEDDIEDAEDKLSDFMKKMYQIQDQSDDELSVSDALDSYLEDKKFSKEELLNLLYFVSNEIESGLADDMNKLSLNYHDDGSDFRGADNFVTNGFVRLPQYLAKEFENKVHLNQIVSSIDYSSQREIRVTTKAGMTYTAEKVISTIPLGVMKKGSVRFIPPLSKKKQRAFKEHLGMGVMNKIWLIFPRVFWDDSTEIVRIPNIYKEGDTWKNKWSWSNFLNMEIPLGKPILLSFLIGDFAREIENLSDEEITDQAMLVLRGLYGADIPKPVKTVITRWGKNPFSEGSFSTSQAGCLANGRDYRILEKPIQNRLFFAGEATSVKYAGSVHGAYLSGIKAAKRVLR
jgi:monoamine oxidase